MTCREYAKYRHIEVIGKLKRMPNRHYGIQNSSYPWYMDEAGNEFLMSKECGKWSCTCIVTADGRIL